ncbi:hypothetical protein SEMRO_845_G209950.1 [Seminavis robusta]|uniref:Uncharacterized protein n=1 Tax=Seminavis robusta TaxID=568900 RepID=A0A9N8HJ95_9STRA|nr:hypothetical protein SEMRO_845_G209950.1 [Seminavis robusta]|eukprot:Sro845_g209950.1 n/a (162) ;mRNA; r:5070-5555
MADHRPLEVVKGAGRPKCIVCRLECGSFFGSMISEAGIKRNVSVCSVCKVPAHNCVPADSPRQIHRLPQFKGKTCFEIAHTPDGLNMWPIRKNLDHKQGPRSHCRTCKVWQLVREMHGLPAKEQRQGGKRKRNETANDDTNTTTNNNNNSEYDSEDEDIYS